MEILNYILLLNEILLKTIWCFQHFLTMEFYRKICNHCYWSNIYNSKNNFFKKTLILTISFIPLLFFSFFYLPTDPANSNKYSVYRSIVNEINSFKLLFKNYLKFYSIYAKKLILFSSSLFDLTSLEIIPKNRTVLNSSLLI